MKPNDAALCQICSDRKTFKELLPAGLVRESVAATIRKKHPKWSSGGYICYQDLNKFRIEHVQDVLETERGELSHLDEQVVKSLKRSDLLARDADQEFNKKLTLGNQLADGLTVFVGSWTFIIIFGLILLLWVAVNTIIIWSPFDPYPFILLNLLLSSVAAFQAPIIMMSQNRQTQKDSLRAEHDYKTDLKAELEIRHINSKIDQLMSNQWQRLLEIQRIQMELIGENFNNKIDNKKNKK